MFIMEIFRRNSKNINLGIGYANDIAKHATTREILYAWTLISGYRKVACSIHIRVGFRYYHKTIYIYTYIQCSMASNQVNKKDNVLYRGTIIYLFKKI